MKNFLLVIDIQNGFIDKNTVSAKTRIDTLIQTGVFDCVIASVYQNYPDSPISRLMGWYGMTMPREQQLVGEAANADYFVYKSTYSAFSASLVEILKKENGGKIPDRVYIAGVDTECCVPLTAADLFENGIRPVVLTFYCGSSGGEEHNNAGIMSIKSIIGESNMSDICIKTKEDIKQ